ncbi:MAG: YCF48-related protein, partial [Calditrichia bacterium]
YVLCTTDGGQTWIQKTNVGAINLQGVFVVNDTIWVTGANGHICYSADGGTTWTDVGPGGTIVFYSIWFNSGLGFACGSDGLIYYWNGTIWVQQLSVPGVTFYSIYTIGGVAYAVGSGGVIYYFNGVSWVLQTTVGVDLYGIYFFNTYFGYAVGANGTIYRTSDGGLTWELLNSGVTVIIHQIIIGDLNTAWAVCDGGLILQTTDGGATWEIINIGIGIDLLGITFVQGQGYIVGAGGIAYTFHSTIVTGDPAFSAFPGSLSFGNVGIGHAYSLVVTVSNYSTAQLTISSVNSTNGDYSISPPSANIPPLGSSDFIITFTPSSAGLKSGNIEFTHNASGSPGIVPVSGTGVETSLTFTEINIGTIEHLRGASFYSSTHGGVAGSGGKVFVTSDGGTTWIPGITGITTELFGIRFIGSVAYIIGANGVICASYDGGFTWTPFSISATENFYGMSFIHAYYGFAVGSNGTICLYDGINWLVQPTGTSESFNGVFAIGATAYAVGTNGIICRYDGTDWQPQVSGVNIEFFDVAFYTELIGYAVGANGTICKTIDGGATWVILNSGVTVDIKSIKIYDSTTVWVTCEGGLVLETTDGGTTWTKLQLDISEDLDGIDFKDCEGIVVGKSGKAYTFDKVDCSLPGSAPYTRLITGTPWKINGVSFLDSLNGCIAGNGGTVLITDDGGLTWKSSNTGIITNLTGIRLVDTLAFITGEEGLICKSEDGGLTWIPFNTGTTVSFYASYFINAVYGFAVGGNGTICVYDGFNWTAQTTNTTFTFYGIYAIGSTGYAVGENGLICKYNGSQWVAQTTNTNITFYDVAFLTEKFGYAVGENGTICRTRDGGITWIPLNSATSVILRSIKIVSAKVAYCLGDDGVILQTTDCGETWTDVSLNYSLKLEGLEIVEGKGYLVGELGEAFSFINSVITGYASFEVSQSQLDFGTVTIGNDRTDSVMVSNDGFLPLIISPVSSDASEFGVTPTSAVINPGDSLVFAITFTPTQICPVTANISFSHNASCFLDTVVVTGMGENITSIDQNINTDWNMIGLPLNTADP